MECPVIPTIQCQLNCPYQECKHNDLIGQDDIDVALIVDRQAKILIGRMKYDEYNRHYKQAHQEEIRLYNQQYRKKHKYYYAEYQRSYAPIYSDIKRTKDRQYYYANRSEILLRQREKYHEDRDLILEDMRKKYAENKEEINRKRRAYQARRKTEKLIEMGCNFG